MALPTESREIKDFDAAAALGLLTKFLVQQVGDATEHGTGQQIVDLVSANIDKTDVGLDNVDNVQQQPLNALLTDIAGLLGTLAKGDIVVYNGSNIVRLARGADGEVLASATAEPTGLEWVPQSGGGGGAGIALLWDYSTTTTEDDPGAGAFRLDNLTIANATELYISDEDANGIDASLLLNSLKVGDRLYLQKPDDATNSALVRVTGVFDNTGWVKITFSVEDTGSAGTWTDTDTFGIMLMFSGTESAPLTQQAVISRAYINGSTGARGTGWVKTPLDTFDEGDSRLGFDPVTSRWTPTIPGWYRLRAAVNHLAGETDTLVSAYINGAEIWRGVRNPSGQGMQHVSPLVYLNGTTDYIELWDYSATDRDTMGDDGSVIRTWGELELVAPTASIFQQKDVTPGDATIEFDLTGIVGHDGNLLIDLIGMRGTTDGGWPEIQVKIGGSWISANYTWSYQYRSGSFASDTYRNITSSAAGPTSVARMFGQVGNDTGESFDATLIFRNPFGGLRKAWDWYGTAVAISGNHYGVLGEGSIPDTGIIEGIRFSLSSGTFAAGKAILRSPYNVGGGGGAGGGHVIVDEDGTELAQRSKLAMDPETMRAFDDAGNDQTIIASQLLRGIVAGDCAMATITGGWTPPTGGVDIIPWNNAPQAGEGNFVLGTGAKYVASEKGRYFGITTIAFDNGSGADDTAEIRVLLNGAYYTHIAVNPENFSRSGREFVQDICFGIDLEVGDEVQLAIFGKSGSEFWRITPNSPSQWVMAKVANDLDFVAHKLPSRVEVNTPDATDYVDNTPAPVIFTNVVKDDDKLYDNTTGEYTAKENTLLLVNAHLLSASVSWSQGNATTLYVEHFTGGAWVQYRIDYDITEAAGAYRSILTGSFPLYLQAGEKARVVFKQQRGANTTLFQDVSVWARFTALPIAIPVPDVPAERIICKVGIAGTQGVAHDAEEKVLLDTPIKDPKGWFNAGSNRIDIKEDGTFDFTGQLAFVDGSINQNNTELQLRLRKNGTTTIALYREGWDTTGWSGRYGRIEAKEIDLVEGDYLEVQVYIYDPSGTGDRNIATSQSQTWFMLSESIENMAVRGAGVGTVLNAPVIAWPNKAINLPGSWSEVPLDFRGILSGNDDGAWDVSDGYWKPKYDGWMLAAPNLLVENSVTFNQDGYQIYVQSSDDEGATWTAGAQRIGGGQPYSPTSSRWAFFSTAGQFYARKDRWYRFTISKEGTAGGPIRNTTETLLRLSPIMTGRSTAHLPTWIPYTPTIYGWTAGFGTVTGRYKDLGDELDCEVFIPVTAGITPVSTILNVGIPSGFIIDPFVSITEPNQFAWGSLLVRDASANISYPGRVANDGTNLDRVRVDFINPSSQVAAIDHDSPIVFAAGDSIHLRFKVPVKRA